MIQINRIINSNKLLIQEVNLMDQVKFQTKVQLQCNQSLICTYEDCDQISKHLCEQCIDENLHQHNFTNFNHIMDRKNLCLSILKNIKLHQKHSKLVNDWISQFKKIETKQDKYHNVLRDYQDLEVQYEQACPLKRNALLKVFNVIQQKLHLLQYQQICVKCFNEEEHNHQQMMQQILIGEQNIRQQMMDGQDLVINIIDSAFYCDCMKNWLFQKPDYKESKITEIKAIINGNITDQKKLNSLIVITNQTFNINKLQKLLLQALEFQQLQITSRNYYSRWHFQLEYSQKQSYDKIFFCELNPVLPQFIVSTCLSEYAFQEKDSNSLIVGDLQTQKIKKIQFLNKTIKIMKFSNNMRHFFCIDDRGYLLCYLSKNYKQLFQLNLHDAEIKAFLPIQNNEIITYAFNGELKITNLIKRKLVQKFIIFDDDDDDDEDNYDYFEYQDQMNHKPNCIEYDEKQKIIFLGDNQIRIRNRKNLHQKLDSEDQYDFSLTYQVQLIQNNTHLLSGDDLSLKQWSFDKGVLDCIDDYQIKAYKFLANDETQRIIIMGKCFFEVVDYKFDRVKIGNFDCSPKSYPLLGTKFQIDEQNQCYIIRISKGILNIQYLIRFSRNLKKSFMFGRLKINEQICKNNIFQYLIIKIHVLFKQIYHFNLQTNRDKIANIMILNYLQFHTQGCYESTWMIFKFYIIISLALLILLSNGNPENMISWSARTHKF
ncbi:hypothetical protein pb186bvf_000943 [Paramecium bursaria]